jgi:uncharacterized protein YbjT (DUF2867 family)
VQVWVPGVVYDLATMKVILFGATGMVGQGVLRECLLAPDVEQVLSVGRKALGEQSPKLREALLPDLSDLAPIDGELAGYDACFFCLGVSSVGMSEDDYRRVTYDLTLSAARLLSGLNPGLTFVYVSGQGTDGTGQGRTMWARVKGKTENDLLALPMKAYMFRPGFIQPLHGVKPKAALYRRVYAVLAPASRLLVRAFPKYATTTERVGRAMLQVARSGAPTHILGNPEISTIGT